ncbi:MAG: tRNA (adenosine(37)-N6)-threonylcarbamoyltransferase complex transferase subunit TsaD, partial [Candidatus Woesebacteria bacterium]|nr:tRNA (adenosine(37)-N6)-threonylcarbamoyltransferase complex transferase subunit TsaD [Candidatus Woesebacteria bacterium]
NIIWSQASSHAKFGGVMPSLAQRMHEERIDWVIEKAIKNSLAKPDPALRERFTMNNKSFDFQDIDAIAVTVGPGLSIALGVGIDRAKKLAIKYNKKLIAVNHLEGHLLSCLAGPNTENLKLKIENLKFPALGLAVSGGNTLLVKINKIGSYETLAQTTDDALGEALDKAARMLGLGYPGGAILEKLARLHKVSAREPRGGNTTTYKLPIPIAGHEERRIFTYSGLKTAMGRLVESEKPLTKEKIINLAACFQNIAFTHLIRVCSYVIVNCKLKIENLLVGGGVSANVELRKRLRQMGKKNGLQVSFPYSKKLTGDNAAMIGVAAYFKAQRGEFIEANKIDRSPNLKI